MKAADLTCACPGYEMSGARAAIPIVCIHRATAEDGYCDCCRTLCLAASVGAYLASDRVAVFEACGGKAE